MISNEGPRYEPPPYTAVERTAAPFLSTIAQLPTIHVQPQFTIINNHINEQQQHVATGTNTTSPSIPSPLPPPIPFPIPFSYPWRHRPGGYFPIAFNMYYRHRLCGRRDYFLGTSHSEPLNQVTIHVLRAPKIALHPGLDKSRTIATINSSKTLGYSGIHATWLIGGYADVGISHVPKRCIFAARVGQAAACGIVESFEWRRTRGRTVYQHFGAVKGWKLMRMNRAAQTVEGAERSRDGAEVVAVLAYWRDGAMDYGYTGYEALKLLSFTFVGAGATAELGEEWALLAVMTALGIWHRNRG